MKNNKLAKELIRLAKEIRGSEVTDLVGMIDKETMGDFLRNLSSACGALANKSSAHNRKTEAKLFGEYADTFMRLSKKAERDFKGV